jgi:putative ABC transport system substrate-binding protein
MRRRELIRLLGGAVAAWPLVAPAQQVGKPPVIGFLGASTSAAASQWTAAFVQRLRELGWIEGRTVAIQYRWAEGRAERFAEIAEEFVKLKVDVVAALPRPCPGSVGAGVVVSLARPGNVTGLSNQTADLVGKRLDLLREKKAPIK